MGNIRDLMFLGIGKGSGGTGLPDYLGHYSFKPNANTLSIEVPVGESFHYAVFISDCPDSVSAVTFMNAQINYYGDAFLANVARIATRKTDGSVGYFTVTSANQQWSYTNGVLTIACTAGWCFGAGVQYDVFYY